MRLYAVFIFWQLTILGVSAQEAGVASYYHDNLTGRVTASGERYDPRKMTAAHRSLPLGTLIRVTNIENEKSVVVRVNDRGPFARNRILDLSRSAASELGFLHAGFAKITYEIIENEIITKDTFTTELQDNKLYVVNTVDSSAKLGFGVKLGSFGDPKLAFLLSKELRQKYSLLAYIQTVKSRDSTLYRIFVGNFLTREDAEQLRIALLKNYPDCKVVSYDTFR